MIHIMMDINKRQDQTFTSRSNIYICHNNGGDLYLLGVNALVFLFNKKYFISIVFEQGHLLLASKYKSPLLLSQTYMFDLDVKV